MGGGGGHPSTGSEWDSDMEVETDPPDWQTSVPPDDLANLPAHEKKRQDVINGEWEPMNLQTSLLHCFSFSLTLFSLFFRIISH